MKPHWTYRVPIYPGALKWIWYRFGQGILPFCKFLDVEISSKKYSKEKTFQAQHLQHLVSLNQENFVLWVYQMGKFKFYVWILAKNYFSGRSAQLVQLCNVNGHKVNHKLKLRMRFLKFWIEKLALNNSLLPHRNQNFKKFQISNSLIWNQKENYFISKYFRLILILFRRHLL